MHFGTFFVDTVRRTKIRDGVIVNEQCAWVLGAVGSEKNVLNVGVRNFDVVPRRVIKICVQTLPVLGREIETYGYAVPFSATQRCVRLVNTLIDGLLILLRD